MLKKTITLLLLLGILLSGCLTTGSSAGGSAYSGGVQPKWLTDIDSAYPPTQYLAVIGEGDTLSKAQAKAASNMAMIFETRIKVDSTVDARYSEIKKQGVFTSTTEKTNVSDRISQSSDQTLSNLKYGESWTDNMGTVFTAAYLNRIETAELYRERINDQTHVLLRLNEKGDKGDTKIERYAYYDSAFVIAMSNEVLLEQLEILHPQIAKTMELGYSLDDVKTTRAETADALTFRLSFSGEKSGAITSVISETFTDMGFTLADNAQLSASGSISFEKIDRNNDYENFKWYLTLEIADETGVTIISLEESGVSASTSESAAISRINVDVKKVINKQLPRQFNAYLNSYLEK